MCVSGYMFLEIRIGRWDFFLNYFICLKYLFTKKIDTGISTSVSQNKLKQLIMVNIHVL